MFTEHGGSQPELDTSEDGDSVGLYSAVTARSNRAWYYVICTARFAMVSRGWLLAFYVEFRCIASMCYYCAMPPAGVPWRRDEALYDTVSSNTTHCDSKYRTQRDTQCDAPFLQCARSSDNLQSRPDWQDNPSLLTRNGQWKELIGVTGVVCGAAQHSSVEVCTIGPGRHVRQQFFRS